MFISRGFMIRHYEMNAVSQRTSEVQAQYRILADYLTSSSYLLDPAQDSVNQEVDQISTLYDGRVLVVDKDMRIVKDSYGMSETKTIISEEIIRCLEGETVSSYDRLNHYIEVAVPIMSSNGDEAQGAVVGSMSTDYIEDGVDILNRSAVIFEVILIAIIVALSAFLSNIIVKPFGRVTQAISSFEEGLEQDSIQVTRNYTEINTIISALNQLLGRMKVLDDSRQEFVSNVSHELKTPLASMKVLADSLLMMEGAPVEMYREFMEDIASEIDRENTIITDLLSLVKMDKKNGELNIKQMNINEMIELILKRLQPIANQNNIEITFESVRDVLAEIDEVKLTLAFSNLVENAIKYNRKDGKVKVTLDADHQFFVLEVADSGIGIPEDSIDHIFERFYRADKSHSREIGGTGLGLAIARSAILMHRGSVKASSVEGEGTTFTVRIPLSYIK